MSDKNSERKDLLIHMYDQMFNDINRHIMVVWQSVGVLVAAFAVFSLTEKQIITLDIATTLIVLLSGWLLAHLLDSGYWYNRNLAIIANIEKEFLCTNDLSAIHYYFGSHRPNNKMLTHLRVQFALGIGIASIVLVFHFWNRIIPAFTICWSVSDVLRVLPYVFLVTEILALVGLRKYFAGKYKEFLENSPGKQVDTTGIRYGTGHGFKET